MSETDNGKLSKGERIELRANCKRAILEHMRTHGDSNYGPVRAAFPQLAKSTVHKYIAEVKAGKIERPALITAARELQNLELNVRVSRHQAAEAADKAVGAGGDRGSAEGVARILPAAPSPDYVAHAGVDAHGNINFLARLDELYRDSEAIRDYSSAKDADGNVRLDDKGRPVVKNPMYFAGSIKLRRDLLETALNAMDKVWDLRRMQEFYDMIVEEVAKASPEVAQEVMRRLSDLNARHGFTYEGNPA